MVAAPEPVQGKWLTAAERAMDLVVDLIQVQRQVFTIVINDRQGNPHNLGAEIVNDSGIFRFRSYPAEDRGPSMIVYTDATYTKLTHIFRYKTGEVGGGVAGIRNESDWQQETINMELLVRLTAPVNMMAQLYSCAVSAMMLF